MFAESIGINASMMRISDAQINKEEGNNAFLQQITIQTETDQANRRIGEGKQQSCKDIIIPDNAIEQVGEDHFPLTIDQPHEHHWLFLFYIKSDQSKFDQNEFLDTERNLIKVANKQMGASIHQSRFLHNTVLKTKWISHCYCKGKKNHDKLCKIEYIWLKGENKIACYIGCHKSAKNKNHLHHHCTCRQGKYSHAIPEAFVHELRKKNFKGSSKRIGIAKSTNRNVDIPEDTKLTMMNGLTRTTLSRSMQNICAGAKREYDQVNKESNREIWKKVTMEFIFDKAEEYKMTVDEFVLYHNKLESLSSNELKQIVVLGHDVKGNYQLGKFTYLTFTTIGNLAVYMGSFDIAVIKKRLTSEMDIS